MNIYGNVQCRGDVFDELNGALDQTILDTVFQFINDWNHSDDKLNDAIEAWQNQFGFVQSTVMCMICQGQVFDEDFNQVENPVDFFKEHKYLILIGEEELYVIHENLDKCRELWIKFDEM